MFVTLLYLGRYLLTRRFIWKAVSNLQLCVTLLTRSRSLGRVMDKALVKGQEVNGTGSDSDTEDRLQEMFDAAVKVIQRLPKDGPYQPSNSTKLRFYSLYKQATEGTCTVAQPSRFYFVERAKWDAWNGLGDMDMDQAKTEYVDQLKKIVETMSFSGDVQDFLEAVNPFYEFVSLHGDEMSGVKEALDQWASSSDTDGGSSNISAQTTPLHAVAEATPPHTVAEATPPRTVAEATPLHTDATPPHTVANATPLYTVAEASPLHTVDEDTPLHPYTDATPLYTVAETTPLHSVAETTPLHSVSEATPLTLKKYPPIHTMSQAPPIIMAQATPLTLLEATPLHTKAKPLTNGWSSRNANGACLNGHFQEHGASGGYSNGHVDKESRDVTNGASPGHNLASTFHPPSAPTHRRSVTACTALDFDESFRAVAQLSKSEDVLKVDSDETGSTLPARLSTNNLQSPSDSERYYSGDNERFYSGDNERLYSGDSERYFSGDNERFHSGDSEAEQSGEGCSDHVFSLPGTAATVRFRDVQLNLILQNTVERLNSDLDHILARVRLLEAAYAAHQRSGGSNGAEQALRPSLLGLSRSALALILTWPFVAYFMIKLVKLWLRRRGRRCH